MTESVYLVRHQSKTGVESIQELNSKVNSRLSREEWKNASECI